MTFEEWCKAYPCPEVETPPEGSEPHETRREAEDFRNFREIEDQHAYRTVRCGDRWYVVLVGSVEDPIDDA